uniref:NADH-ubiquinone oxidoreductase chain 2 n=1 Tax=Graphis scripta TaxID=71600 RepID=A0A4P8DNP9_9LECA|nr:NADH dehydrogenase subunit 2 [Graphis scripta]
MLIVHLILLLSSNATASKRDISIYFSRTLLYITFNALILSLSTLNMLALNKGLGLYNGLFNSTPITNTFHIFIFFISFIILLITSFYPRKVWSTKILNPKTFLLNIYIFNTKLLNKMSDHNKILEYPLILLFVIIGATLLVSSSDIISIFLSIELQSYGLYLVASVYRDSELSTSAGLTYFLLGGLSSCFILLGTGLLYANSGVTNLDGFYLITSVSEIKEKVLNLISVYDGTYINYSLLIMSTGFLFKVSAAPFHFWSPDVYDAVPTIVTTFVANIPKISIFVFLLEIVHYTSNYFSLFNFNWTIILLISSLLSLIIGTVLGLNQSRIKRLLAYSTISHLGFILLALSINSIESIQAFIFYIMQYSITNVNAFVIIISIGYSLYIYTNKNKEYKSLPEQYNSPIQLISQLKGYFFINPTVAISLIIVIYSFVGIPPLTGFFGKQMVLSSALDKGYTFLALVAILTSVISAVYYLNIVKELCFYKGDYKLNKDLENKSLNSFMIKKSTKTKIPYDWKNISLSTNLSLSISILTLIILLFMLSPNEWLRVANILAILMFN